MDYKILPPHRYYSSQILASIRDSDSEAYLGTVSIDLLLVTEIVKTMHISASSFQLLKIFTSNSQIIFLLL